jgi:hypothetical protein
VEEDGLEYFYAYGTAGQVYFLLTNNIPIEDREKMQRIYWAYERNKYLAWFGGLWLGLESIIRIPYFKHMALGWKALSVFGIGWLVKEACQFNNSRTYGPILSAFIRKHGS